MALKGQNLGNQNAKGYRHTQDAILRISEASKGNQYAKGMGPNQTSFKKGRVYVATPETRAKLSKVLKGRKMPWVEGAKNFNWKGGVTPANKMLREISGMKQWRDSVFLRDKYLCQMPNCDKIERFLEAHHIKRFIDFPEERMSVKNGITLCKSCHNRTKGGKETQFERLFIEIINLHA